MRVPNPNDRPPIGVSVIVMAVIAAAVVYGTYKNGTLSKITLLSYAVLVPAVIIHEISHGYLANLFGDPTAKRAGRLTLNPLRHVDPIGTFILPAVLLLASHGGTAFGYAKPVPVNVSRMSRNKAMFVGLIGPATNLLLLAIATVLIQLVYGMHSLSHGVWEWTLTTLLLFGRVNIVLAIFNMIPIPPLDGASVVERFLPAKYLYQYLQFRKYAMILLLILTLAYQRVLAYLFDPAIRFWLDNFTPFHL